MKKAKKITYLFFLIILFNAGLSAAETEKETPFRIGTGLGYSFTGYREETDLPLNRTAHSFAFLIDANIEKGNLLYSFNFNFLYGKNDAIKIKTNEDYFTYYQKESDFYRVSFENALDCRLWGSPAFPGYLGGALRGDVYLIYLPETFYYCLTAVLSLNAHVTQKLLIDKKNTIVFSASIPIFGYAARPPYYGLLYSPLDLDANFVSLHNYWALFFDVKYLLKINSLISFYSNLGAELSHINFPQPRKDASIRLNAGISFTF